MNEVERLAYLDVMDVMSYVPRLNLPGAKPSVLCDLNGCESLSEPAITAVPHRSTEIKRPENSGKNALSSLQSSLGGQKVVASQKKTVVDSLIEKNAPLSTMQNQSAQNPVQINVRFQWAILQPSPELLILIPAAQCDESCMQLLRSILTAISIPNPVLTPIENFIWPPALSSSSNLLRLNNSLADARETLQALLEGYQLKQKQDLQITNVLVFDGNLGKAVFEGVVIPDIQIRILPSLQLMSVSSPEKISEAKKVTWQKLKDLKKS